MRNTYKVHTSALDNAIRSPTCKYDLFSELGESKE